MCNAGLEYKKKPAGREWRLAALRHSFPDIDATCAATPSLVAQVGRDDIVDAFIALWSALRFRGGVHESLGGGVRDSEDLPTRIVV